jgi:hypothetical protein
MYSARRSQIEHKVRAARQRTMAPLKHAEKASKEDEGAHPAAPVLTYEPSAYAGPPVAPPPKKAPDMPTQPAWDAGPTAPAPSTPTFPPPAPPYEPPQYQPPTAEPPAAQPAWTPSPPTPEPERPTPAPAPPAMTSAGAGASWSVVGETKGIPEPERAGKKKKGKQDPQAGAWSLASGELAGEGADEGARPPSAMVGIIQYAVFALGLGLVLIGVVIMLSNSHAA